LGNSQLNFFPFPPANKMKVRISYMRNENYSILRKL
jgi:hypothetical protein